VLAIDGCFYIDAAFMVCSSPDTAVLKKLFHYEMFKMLKVEAKIMDVVIENMMNWCQSGFNVYCVKAKWPYNQEGLKKYYSSLIFSRAHDIFCGAGYIRRDCQSD